MIGITMGDAAGVGPEIVLKALNIMTPEQRKELRIYGCGATLEAAQAIVGTRLRLGSDVDLQDIPVEGAPIIFGKMDPRAGDAAFRMVEAAVADAQKGDIACIVTAPINKAALNAAGHHYDGHTGMLAALTGIDHAFMLLASDKLKTIHVSTHVSLREAINRVRSDQVLATIRVAAEHLTRFGIEQPRIAVAGINPHCGEGGLFGNEDTAEIEPAVAAANNEGIDTTGPIPADSVFYRASKGEFDLVVAQYHDQGHIPIKLLAFETAVNVSLGLPIDRTSVDHGTAFDIAGQGIAKHDNLLEAIAYATKLMRGKTQ